MTVKDRLLTAVVPAIMLLLLGGCSSLPKHVLKEASYVTVLPEETPMGRSVQEQSRRHAGQSGFTLLRSGRSAFTSRMLAIRMAEKSLDLQYYIWEADTTGMILARELIRAANRGVRVRLLLDDNNMQGYDRVLAAMNSHPNIQIRIFNPFANRESHLFDAMTDFSRINHRMHNKVLAVDNAIAIVGGRNIGDHYFAVNPQANFRDLDVVAAGPIVEQISDTFDEFWNGPYALPAEKLVAIDSQHDGAHLEEKLTKALEKKPYPYSLTDDLDKLQALLADYEEAFVWAKAEVVYDRPESIEGESAEYGIASLMTERLLQARQRVYIESAYFVASGDTVANVAKLIDDGVDIRVLTNSLASNDVIAAHAGYAEFREALIREGVEVHELRPDSEEIRKAWSVALGASKAGLHTKALVIDDDKVFVGSYNLDPRSANINTEIGLLIYSEALNAQLAEYMAQGRSLKNSYQVYLNKEGKLRWRTLEGGVLIEYKNEPKTHFWQRFFADFIELLPVQSQL
ncbi:putative cardiolipin synthase [Sinobacterium caligoides]|uniref:Putative cardiolipin synthase n=1 Tax=Sinobacterium caligoides TaxID=933926 RepID=A0A3N2DHC7_9GAMM|nr:phospholipase D family protein [Sinobacterium caligoides]ROR98784.1 putative cardiolipin synthase [Sinobacterium caligoides]